MTSLGLIIFTIFTIASGLDISSEIISIFLVARHGERYPCHSFSHPNYPKEFLEQSCRLTERGAKQHFALGQFIRNRYSHLITSDGFHQNEVHLRSTGTERTILSASYFGLGFNSHLSTGMNILPAVFSSPKRFDYLLKMSYPCRFTKRLYEKSLESDAAKKFAESEHQLFEDLRSFTGLQSDPRRLHESLPQMWKQCEPIYVWSELMRSSGNKAETLPFTPELASACHRALSFRQKLRFGTSEQTAIHGGPLWNHVVNLLRRQACASEHFSFNGDAADVDVLDIPIASETRITAYFAHDSTLTAFLSHLGMFNGILPPYASAVIVELHRLSNNKLALRFFYHNSSQPSTEELVQLKSTFCGKDAPLWCPLDVLEANLQGTVADDVESACSADESGTSILPTAFIALMASLAFSCALPVGFTVRFLLCLISVFLTYRFMCFLF